MKKQNALSAAFSFFIGAMIGLGSAAAHGASGEGVDQSPTISAYTFDNDFAVFRSGVTGADALTTTNVCTTLTKFYPWANTTGNKLIRTNIPLSVRFNTSGATATVQIAYLSYDGTNYYIKDWGPLDTFTASTVEKEGSYYEALGGSKVYDSQGAYAMVVTVQSVSTGTVAYWMGSY